MAVSVRMRLSEKIEREGWAYDPAHFAPDATCRTEDGGFIAGLCEHTNYLGVGSVTAKFKVVSGKQNALWSAATPDGEMTLVIQNPDAFDYFDAGSEYNVTIQKARR